MNHQQFNLMLPMRDIQVNRPIGHYQNQFRRTFALKFCCQTEMKNYEKYNIHTIFVFEIIKVSERFRMKFDRKKQYVRLIPTVRTLKILLLLTCSKARMFA